MDEFYLTSTRDAVLVAVPFLAILALAIFRLDAFFAASKSSMRPAERHRRGCGMDEDGEPILVDPDGRPSNSDGRLTTIRSKAR
jgi:hypothetical protein